LFESSGKLCVRDLGSLNGTYVNNERITESTVLPSGDLLTVGSVTFRAVYSDQQPMMPPSTPGEATVRSAANRTIVDSARSAAASNPPLQHVEGNSHAAADEVIPIGDAEEADGLDMEESAMREFEAGGADGPNVDEVSGPADLAGTWNAPPARFEQSPQSPLPRAALPGDTVPGLDEADDSDFVDDPESLRGFEELDTVDGEESDAAEAEQPPMTKPPMAKLPPSQPAVAQPPPGQVPMAQLPPVHDLPETIVVTPSQSPPENGSQQQQHVGLNEPDDGDDDALNEFFKGLR
jgi:hypothetical protein